MVIQTKVEVDGVEFSDYQNMRVSKTTNNFNSISNYRIRYDSPYGRHNDDFSVGDTIEIFADGTDASTTLLKGIIDRVKFIGRGTSQVVDLIGRDFTSRLNDSTVLPVVYTDSEISTIVTNIIDNNVPNVTTNNVDVTETTLQRMVFNHSSVFDALTELAELAGYFFYIDSDSDLHFEKKDNVDSGISLDNTNITRMLSNTTREGMANSIWVYGDRQLSGFREVNINNGSVFGGSVFTLLSKPHNTLIEYLGNPLKGGVHEMAVSPTSGPDYLVSFEDKQLIFQSGTEIGYSSIPISGGSILSVYDREIPIVKFGENEDSINAFGKKVKVINDKTIRDPTTALDILKSELEKSDPFNGLEVNINGWFDITPGNTLKVTLDDFNIDKTIGILDVDYTFDKNTIQSEKVIKVRLDTKILDITDQITDLHRRLGLIEAQDRQDSDIITRLMQATGSASVVGSMWWIQTRTQTGSTLYLSDSTVTYGTLASGTSQNVLAGSATSLGSPHFVQAIITSGGNF